jgi:hypothetical protein
MECSDVMDRVFLPAAGPLGVGCEPGWLIGLRSVPDGACVEELTQPDSACD